MLIHFLNILVSLILLILLIMKQILNLLWTLFVSCMKLSKPLIILFCITFKKKKDRTNWKAHYHHLKRLVIIPQFMIQLEKLPIFHGHHGKRNFLIIVTLFQPTQKNCNDIIKKSHFDSSFLLNTWLLLCDLLYCKYKRKVEEI